MTKRNRQNTQAFPRAACEWGSISCFLSKSVYESYWRLGWRLRQVMVIVSWWMHQHKLLPIHRPMMSWWLCESERANFNIPWIGNADVHKYTNRHFSLIWMVARFGCQRTWRRSVSPPHESSVLAVVRTHNVQHQRRLILPAGPLTTRPPRSQRCKKTCFCVRNTLLVVISEGPIQRRSWRVTAHHNEVEHHNVEWWLAET